MTMARRNILDFLQRPKAVTRDPEVKSAIESSAAVLRRHHALVAELGGVERRLMKEIEREDRQ